MYDNTYGRQQFEQRPYDQQGGYPQMGGYGQQVEFGILLSHRLLTDLSVHPSSLCIMFKL